jgi:hypothetical protein
MLCCYSDHTLFAKKKNCNKVKRLEGFVGAVYGETTPTLDQVIWFICKGNFSRVLLWQNGRT